MNLNEITISDEEMNEFFEGIINEQKEKTQMFLVRGHTIFNIVNIKKSIMDDDNLYLNENDVDYRKLQEQDNLVYIVVSHCIEYANHQNIDVQDRNQLFYTEKIFVNYNKMIYKCESVSGQGTFNRITLIDNLDEVDKPIIYWQNILDYYINLALNGGEN